MDMNAKFLKQWLNRATEEIGSKFSNIAHRHLLNPETKLVLFHNNETGLWQWSLAVKDSDFWFDSFCNRKEGIEFIRKMGIKDRVIVLKSTKGKV